MSSAKFLTVYLRRNSTYGEEGDADCLHEGQLGVVHYVLMYLRRNSMVKKEMQTASMRASLG